MTQFSTQDLNLAAFVWSSTKKFDLIKLAPKLEGSKTVYKFVFDFQGTQDELSSLLLDYHNGKASVEPVQYVQKQNHLRDQIRLAGK
jgi:hypothetical protein